MPKFAIKSILDLESNVFDRQERIDWWSQDKVVNAKIMVIGAGAIGNETLKNLALLGVRNIFVVDFDTISKSNLSRTVLFRSSDVGLKKSEIAAKRTRELCLSENSNIDWFHGDVVWDLGTGIYREMDLVLGCLDNIETRFHVNRQCMLAQTPWIDAGIMELGVRVTPYLASEPPCYECGMTKEQREAIRKRYSCDDFKRAMFQEGKIPTVQIASSIASAIQVQEAMKYLCGQQIQWGKAIYYQGKINDFDVNQIPIKPECAAHVTYGQITSLPIQSTIRLREFLSMLSETQFSGEKTTLTLEADRYMIISTRCRSCGEIIEFYRPAFRIFDSETVCRKCNDKGIEVSQFDPNVRSEKKTVSEFDLDQTESRILDMTLQELGVPLWHIVTIKDQLGIARQYELIGDRDVLIPSFSKISNNALS